MLRRFGTKFQFQHLALKLMFLFSTVCCIYIAYYRLKYRQNSWMQANDRLELVQNLINSDENKYVCKPPILPIDSPEIMQYMKKVDDIHCQNSVAPDMVTCQISTCEIKQSLKFHMKNITCEFRDVIRKDDFNVLISNVSVVTDKYALVRSDSVIVKCTSLYYNWSSVKTAIRLDPSIWARTGWELTPPDGLRMNVFLFAIDSLSRNMFIRKLPLTYKYLVEVLGGHVLQSYNVVGDASIAQVTPILTGQMELELPEVRQKSPKGEFVDIYPFIWKEYRANGYVTAFLEDCVILATYNYRLRGFKVQPTDHVMKTYYSAATNMKFYSNWKQYCDGDIPRHRALLNQIKNFFTVYQDKPKFIFSFLSELSHDDYNLVAASDKDIVDCLKYLFTSNALNNTIFILMADHGSRLGSIRNTLQGKLEERLPFYSFTFPPWFKTVHKELYENFLSNINTLTSPFDIHATLSNILHTNGSKARAVHGRSLSLFSTIPKNRTCADAFIGPHWCACLVWDALDISDKIVPSLVQTFENTLNNYTLSLRHICAYLTVTNIMNVTKLRANDKLLKFKHTDVDGFIPVSDDSTQILTDMYQIKVQTTPGGGIYEAGITYSLTTNKTNLKLSDVSRINKYGSQARCVEYKYRDYRKYCYCTSD